MSDLQPMVVLVFKTGYEYLETRWDSLKEDILLSKKIKWEDIKPIIPLKKLTMEERKRQLVPAPPDEALKEKIQLMLKEMNKDYIEQGLGPIDVGR